MCDDENYYLYVFKNFIWKIGCLWILWKFLEYDRFIFMFLEIDNV